MIKQEKEELISRMNKLASLIPDTVSAIKSLPNKLLGHLYTTLNPGELQIKMDYVPKEYLALRRLVAKDWRYVNRDFNDHLGDYFIYMCHRTLKDVELTIQLVMPDEYEEGVSCKIVEIGHKIQTIYGLECK